jgi:predicted permease
MGNDLRYALRSFSRAPAFTVPAVACLALAIAVNTILFSVVNAVLLRPLGAAGRDVVRIGRSERGEQLFRSTSYEEFEFLRTHSTAFAELVGEQMEAVPFEQGGVTRMASAEVVAGDYFGMLGVRPGLGQGFVSDFTTPGEATVVVTSDRFWRRHLASDPAVLGRSIRLNDVDFTIVGVAPGGFAGTFPGVDIDFWLPVTATGLLHPDARGERPSMQLMGRLRPGTSLGAARAELRVLSRRVAAEVDGADPDREFVIQRARGVHPAFAGVLRIFLFLLMAVVGVVLLIACANVASLLLARGVAREGELAVRAACGASRWRLVRQLLSESLVLAAAGGVAGVLLSFWPVRVLSAYSPADGPTGAPIAFDLRLDVRVLAFAVAIAALTAVIFGLVPALRAGRLDLVGPLRGVPASRRRRRVRLGGALVVGQVASSCVLLVATGLLLRSLHHAGRLDLGFEPDQVIVAGLDLRASGYDRRAAEAFHARLLERVRSLPGVEGAAMADFIPMADAGGTLSAPDVPAPPGEEAFTVPFGVVSDGYFATVRQPLELGRDFTARDREGAPRVAIVNQALARRVWPDRNPLGQRLTLEGEGRLDVEVVGVARDARFASFGGDIGPLVLLPALQHYGPPLILHARVATSEADAVAAVSGVIRELDSRLVVTGRTMRERMAFSLVPARTARVVFGVAGAIALLIASAGLYGLVAYTLERRSREIGICLALGARRRDVFRLAVGSAVRLAIAGLVVGLVIAAGAMRLLSSMLYGLGPTDPVTFAGVGLLLAGVTLAAASAAGRRALSVDPVWILRSP